jgi:hypothetical protein
LLTKQKVYDHCISLLNIKIEELSSALSTATESANNETKSTAGDKHETARAMMQLEQEKLSKQLKELYDQRSELEKTGIPKPAPHASKGSLIASDKGFLFLSVGLGKMNVNGETVFAVSPQSPLGKLLIGKKEKDSVEMNGVRYLITSII